MLDANSLNELREVLEGSANPIFYYDNDADGLCSFLLLRRWLGRGYGIAIRGHPGLGKDFAKKAKELGADKVFVLDKPVIGEEFFEEIREYGLEIVIIDHHKDSLDYANREGVVLYNDYSEEDGAGRPVSSICYELVGNKGESWIAMMGCIADHYLPEFVDDFKEKFGEYWNSGIEKPFDAYYGSEIGKLAMALNFGLKDSTSNIVKLQKYLSKIKGPDQILAEVSGNDDFRKKYNFLKGKFDGLISDESNIKEIGKILFFDYSGDVSMSSDIANYLSYKYKDKILVVAYTSQGFVNISIRGSKVRDALEKVLEKVDGNGGGHEDAVGARIGSKDLEEFKVIFEASVNG
jgi:single-stranded DNA-specific DHH superfamily exonuclease